MPPKNQEPQGFFENPDVIDLVETTVRKVEDLERDEQTKLIRVFRKVRTELQDRLLLVSPNSFSEQQIQLVLVQVQAAIEAISRDLKNQMSLSADVLGLAGVEDLTHEVMAFSSKFEGAEIPLPIDAILVAADTKEYLINKYQASLDAYSASLRSQITSNILQSVATRDNTQGAVARLNTNIGRFFIGEEWKLNRIVRTELHNIYNFAKLKGMGKLKQGSTPDLKKALLHPMDHRTAEDSKQLARSNPVVDIDKPFMFKFKRKLKNGKVRVEEREFMFPPDRPNDRSILIPYRKAWGKAAAGFKTG